MAATLTLIQTYRLSSNQNTITFSSIPQTYTDLKMIVSARCTATGQVRRYMNCNINGSSSNNNYVRSIAYATNNTVSDFDTVNSNYAVVTTDGAASNTFSQGEFYFSNYTNTSEYKAVNYTGAALAEISTEHMVGIWGAYRTTTSAITSISFVPEIGDFTANTVFSLYGIKNS